LAGAASVVEDGWFEEAEVDGWFEEAEVDGWLADDVVEDWFDEAEVDGWLADAEADGWFIELDAVAADAPATEARPGMSALACLALSIAACVLGPITPSTGPGSKPLSFRACWSCFTDSSPFAMLALESLFAELGWLADADWLVDADADWLVEADAEGWFAEAVAAGWFIDAAGWLADADLSVFAMTEPAVIRAATRASFLNCMVVILSSYTKREDTVFCRAVPFGHREPHKLQRGTAPSDASALSAGNQGRAT
jgi:hypothetical protein